MNTAANAPADLAADLRRTAEQRVSTCDMYIGQRALVLHNTVVVSSIHNGRGVCLQGARTIIQMFPKGMPTCYSPEDARTLCEDVNAALVEQGLEERVSCMAARDWWEEERQAALRAIAFMDKHDVR